MKKYLLLLLILAPLKVFANEYIEFECDKNINKGKTFECVLYANSSYDVSALEYTFSYENAELIEFDVDKTWQGSEDNNTLMLYTDENKNGRFILGKLKMIANKKLTTFEIKHNRLIYFDDSFLEHEIIKSQKKVSTKSVKSEKRSYIKNNIIIICVIIILGIVLTLIVLKRKGSEKGE